ncbi:MAG: hypothetical protein QME94_16745 [Anaerolineae bacterium]|nr:hypothetical protein [Anaerolineae bacterium]
MDGASWRRARGIVEGIGLFAATLLLVASWCCLFLLLALKSRELLAPWADAWPGMPLPMRGTWERTLNDFCKRAPGMYLPGALLVGSSTVLFLQGITRARLRAIVPLAFLGTNLLFLVAYTVLQGRAYLLPDLWLPQPRPGSDVGYHRTWPELVLHAVSGALLVWAQSRLRFLGGVRRAPEDQPRS